MSAVDPTLFPEDFLWGAATSAYQIEGSPLADGAGASNWHRFSHTPGMTTNGETGDIAADHYRRMESDVALMSRVGLKAYRFSISWSRVLPTGRGQVNTHGLDFYSRLVDALLTRGITPVPTLFHWDYPAALDELGGWLHPDSAAWFADYATQMFRALGDRVSIWTTLNEPWVVVDAGYLHGVHAPGHRSPYEAARVAQALLRAHGLAVQAFRVEGKGRIGLVVNLEPKEPASSDPGDLEACERSHQYMNRQFLDPVLLGRDPERMPEIYGDAWTPHTSEELAITSTAIDFLGINYYKRGIMRASLDRTPPQAEEVRDPSRLHTLLGWESHADSLARILLWVKQTYGDLPLYITENGAAFYDPPTAIDGCVQDPLRVHYLREHLEAARRAISAGVNLKGYFAWSLLDNYEWAAGYAPRFGLIHVDFATQERTLKSSAYYYRDVIGSRGAALGDMRLERD